MDVPVPDEVLLDAVDEQTDAVPAHLAAFRMEVEVLVPHVREVDLPNLSTPTA